MYLGVDWATCGWIAISYNDRGYNRTHLYDHFEDLWASHGDSAELILIDVPIGLREDSSMKRPCDDAARKKLGQKRGSSVFAVPVRDAVYEDNYEDAKATQEELTEGSLGRQSWNIADKITQLDIFLRETEPDATNVVREAHPEVCFWAFNDESSTDYSKTGQPAAAYWERVGILENIDSEITMHIREAGTDLNCKVGNEDIIDAFALALTAYPKTGPLLTLPEEWPEGDEGDPTGLPMEMVYADH